MPKFISLDPAFKGHPPPPPLNPMLNVTGRRERVWPKPTPKPTR